MAVEKENVWHRHERPEQVGQIRDRPQRPDLMRRSSSSEGGAGDELQTTHHHQKAEAGADFRHPAPTRSRGHRVQEAEPANIYILRY